MKRSSIFAFISLLFISVNFIACDNFLNSGDIKKEIEDVIAFNNATVVNVSLECDKDVGTLFPNQTYQARLGYPFEVQFIPNTDNYQIKDVTKIFKAESLRDKENPDRSSYVDIQVIEQSFEDKKSGVYRANITITKYADDIRIKPECISVPVISQISPENKRNGEDQDTPIIITFNKAMNPESFGDFSCISISNSTGSLWDYYDTPEFSDDKTKLTIQPKAGTLLLPPDEAKTSDEITLTIDCADIKDTDGLSLTQTSAYSFRINQNYGNKKVVDLTIKVDDSSMGTITPDGKVSCNLGYTTTLKFEMNKNDFILSDSETALKAVSANGGSVSFTTLSTIQTENTIIYTIKARVLKEANDIVISPNCIKVPKLLSITPQQISTGCDQDTPIKIKFNKAVDPESFGNFSCISISNDNQDLKQYFGTPYFSENNTTLTIPTAQNTLILPPDGSKLQMEITVNIDAANLKDEDNIALPQIEKYRYTINKNFGNQKKITVLIRTVEGTGTFLVDGERECVVGYSLGELQFTPNAKSAVFLGLEAVSKNDTSVSRNDSVEFTQVNNTNGVYIIRVRVKEEVNDILIRPKYILRPAIVKTTPSYADYATEPIVITFNTPVEDESVKPEDSIFSFDNITIKCNNTTISNKFNPPTLNEDKTVLTIVPKTDEFNSFLATQASSLYSDITVSFDQRTIFEIDGNYLNFAEDKSLDMIVHYCTQVEMTPPQEMQFNIYRDWDTTTRTGSNPFDLSYDLLMDECDNYYQIYTDDRFIANRTRGTVYIYGQYNDDAGSGSGVGSVYLKEYRNSELNEEYMNDKTIVKEYTETSDNVLFWNSFSDGTTKFCIQEQLDFEDGIISITSSVKDKCGNSSTPKEISVVKTTEMNFWDSELQNIFFFLYGYSDDPMPFDMDTYEDELRDIKMIYTDENSGGDFEDLISEESFFAASYGYRDVDPHKAYTSVKCQYYDDDNVLQTREMAYEAYTGEFEGAYKWHYYIDEDEVKDLRDLSIRIIAEDDLGNSFYQDYKFPGKMALISDVKNDDGSRTMQFVPQTEGTTRSGLLVFKQNNTWMAKRYYDDIDISIPDGTEFYLIPSDDNLAGQMSEKFIAGNLNTQGLYPIGYDSISYERGDKQNVNITVKVSEDSLNYFDIIFARFGSRGKTLYPHYLSKGENSILISYTTTNLYSYEYVIQLCGIKDGVCSEGEEVVIHKFDNPQFDNVNPKITSEIHPRFPEYYSVRIRDDESGISRIYYNNKLVVLPEKEDDDNNAYVYHLNIQNDELFIEPEIANDVKGTTLENNLLLPLGDVLVKDEALGIPILKFEIKVYDKAENETILNINKKINPTRPWRVYSKKSSTSWEFASDDFSSYSYSCYYLVQGKWRYYSYSVSAYNRVEGGEAITSAMPIPWPCFVRIYHYLSKPVYFYNGRMINTGTYDFILPDDTSESSVLISSDAPVYVHTAVTSISYQKCKDWTVDDWDSYKKIVGPELVNITTGWEKKQYDIPLDEIESNQCYVVIAHFADGTTAMSDVKIKY